MKISLSKNCTKNRTFYFKCNDILMTFLDMNVKTEHKRNSNPHFNSEDLHSSLFSNFPSKKTSNAFFKRQDLKKRNQQRSVF